MRIILKIIKGILKSIFMVLFLVTILFFAYSYCIKIFVENKNINSIKPENTKIINIKVNGQNENFAYQEYNSSSTEVLMFVGGLSGWGYTWKRSVESLNNSTNNKYKIIIIDIAPFGFSERSENNSYDRVTQAARINSFVKSKNLKDITFVAHSYGAGLAAEAIIQNKNDYKKFVIIDGVLSINDKTENAILTKETTNNINQNAKNNYKVKVKNFILENIIRVVVHTDILAKNRLESFVYIKDFIDKDMLARYVLPTYKISSSKNLAEWASAYGEESKNNKSNFIENYTDLKIPVRLIWGIEDTLTPIKETEILLSNIKDIKIEKLEDVGHIPMIENYEKFDKALLNSLDK